MFNRLSEKLVKSLNHLRGRGRISEKNIEEAIRSVRLSLLDADVHFKVVKTFIDRVKDKALGQKIIESLTADQQFFKIVHDELVNLLGTIHQPLQLKGSPGVIFLVGLQGSGKTTTASKLAWFLRKDMKRKPGLVSVDIYRPAAQKQLQILAKKHDLPFCNPPPEVQGRVEDILKFAFSWAKDELIEVLLVDTAGRLQIDQELMSELKNLTTIGNPSETLLVIDAMLGQEAINIAKGFQNAVALTGVCLTKIEGDARGGGALSLRETTKLPIKFFGVGESIEALQVFHPDRLVSRLLDQGDILSLVEKTKDVLSENEARDSVKKIKERGFTLEDFLKQIRMTQKMGGIQNIMKMLPGMKQKFNPNMISEKEVKKMEAIICSMTLKERQNTKILNSSRRLRISKGSGTQVQDVNKLVRKFEESKKFISSFMKGKGKGFSPFDFFK